MKTDKKGEFLKGWIERKMSKHDWFNGVKYVVIETFRFRDKEVPDYVFYLDTGGFGVSQDFDDEFDSIFKMFFPTDLTYDPSAVWEFRYV
jgi:hypothetical protein